MLIKLRERERKTSFECYAIETKYAVCNCLTASDVVASVDDQNFIKMNSLRKAFTIYGI